MTHLFGGYHGGWKAQLPGVGRDRPYVLRAPPGFQYPKASSNRAAGLLPPILDQGQLGSCTANAGVGALNYSRMHQGLAPVDLSRLALYYWTRNREGTASQDSGATIADTIWVMQTFGVGLETDWPYDITKFAQQPPGSEVVDGLKERVLQDQLVDNTDLNQIKDSLFNGCAIQIGFTVMQSFNSIGEDGLMPMPWSQESVLGGHSVFVIDYDDDAGPFPQTSERGGLLCQNSWGTNWGCNLTINAADTSRGYFWFPYGAAVDKNLADDWWSVQLVMPQP